MIQKGERSGLRHLPCGNAISETAGACVACMQKGIELCQAIRERAPMGYRPPSLRRFARGKQIAEMGTPAGFVGVIRKGYVRNSLIRMSGQRILLGLAVPGDVVGGLPGQVSYGDLEAATDLEICVHDGASVSGNLEGDKAFLLFLLREADETHRRFLDSLWRYGTLTSRERIMAFLVWAAGIMQTELLPDGSIVLTMEIDRRDWADLTNTAVETISRTLRYLEEKGLLASLSPYRFRISSLHRLAVLAGVEPPELRGTQRDCALAMRYRPPVKSTVAHMTAVNALPSLRSHAMSATKPFPAPSRGKQGGSSRYVEEIRD